MELRVTCDEAEGTIVHVQVRLGARDHTRIFAAGDHLIQLPVDGLLHDADGPPVERSSIFLSELASMPAGLTRAFADSRSARAFLTGVSAQLEAVRRDLETE